MGKYVSDIEDEPEPPKQEVKPDNKPYESDIEAEPPPPEQAPAPSWSEVPWQAAQHLGGSLVGVASNMVQPVLHPIDTAEGFKNIGMGVMEKMGLTEGDTHIKYADAVGKMLYDQYGTIDNIKRTLANDPAQVAADISMLFSGGETALAKLGMAGKVSSGLGATARVLDPVSTATGMAARKILQGKRPPGAEPPTTEEHFNLADKNYDDMRALPIEINTNATARISDNIAADLLKKGYRDYAGRPDGALFRVVEELKNPANGQTSRMADIEAVRSALNRLAKNPELRDGARLAQKHIDGFLSNIHPSDIVAHPQLAPELNRLATEARGNYAAGSRSEVLDNARDKAILSAHASQGAGTNVDARMRAEIKNILTNERLRRGFSQEELAQMRELIKPPSGQFSRLIGKAAPTGIISAGLGAELGYHLLGSKWAALPAVGYAAKKLADRRTAIRFDKLSEAVRTRSPEGARRAAYNASIQPKGRTPMALQRGLQQEGRFVTPQGENQSRGGAVDRALRLARKH